MTPKYKISFSNQNIKIIKNKCLCCISPPWIRTWAFWNFLIHNRQKWGHYVALLCTVPWAHRYLIWNTSYSHLITTFHGPSTMLSSLPKWSHLIPEKISWHYYASTLITIILKTWLMSTEEVNNSSQVARC